MQVQLELCGPGLCGQHCMLFDFAAVDWLYVAVLAMLVFIATLVGISVLFGRQLVAAAIAALVFTVLFIIWTYYPHRVPGPRTLRTEQGPTRPTTAAPTAPLSPPVAGPPSNPVKDITPAPPPR